MSKVQGHQRGGADIRGIISHHQKIAKNCTKRINNSTINNEQQKLLLIDRNETIEAQDAELLLRNAKVAQWQNKYKKLENKSKKYESEDNEKEEDDDDNNNNNQNNSKKRNNNNKNNNNDSPPIKKIRLSRKKRENSDKKEIENKSVDDNEKELEDIDIGKEIMSKNNENDREKEKGNRRGSILALARQRTKMMNHLVIKHKIYHNHN